MSFALASLSSVASFVPSLTPSLFGLALTLAPMPPLATLPTVPLADAAAAQAVEAAADDETEAEESVGDALAHRARMAQAHRRIGIAMWAGMTWTTIAGTMQYVNKYGGAQDETRCAQGEVILQETCSGTATLHLVPAVVTGALFYTNFGMAFAMPDPLDAASGDSDRSRRLRTHKRLRWATFSLLTAQILLGAIIAHPDLVGLHPATDYETMRGLASLHLALGYTSYGLLTWTGALMVR